MVLTRSAFCNGIAVCSRIFVLSCALVGGAVAVSVAPALAEEAGIWDKVMNTVGLGGAKPADRAPANPVPVQPVAAAPAQANPVQPVPAPVAAAPQKPGMFDNVLKSVGLGGPKPGESIDYSERPKLALPQQRVLPPPRESGGPRQIARSPETEALTKPPAEYLQKVPGADGQVSGLKDSDVSKDKKFFGLF
jgi:hypothetical protein